jgi:thiol:disulfide interchange protein
VCADGVRLRIGDIPDVQVRWSGVVVLGVGWSLLRCESPGSHDHSEPRSAASAPSNGLRKPWPPFYFRDDLEQALATATREQRPVVVWFFADWDYKELARTTLVDAQLVSTHGRFVGIRVDATNEELPGVRAALRRFRVTGIPTILILDSTGKEVRRIDRFVDATELSSILANVP